MTNRAPFHASCHCGAVRIGIDALPAFLMDCNCSLCASHGALWGYYAPGSVSVEGETRVYRRADKPDSPTLIHFCGQCGSTSHFSSTQGDAVMIGINMRLFDPAAIKGLEVHYADGRNWDGAGPWGYRRDHAPFE